MKIAIYSAKVYDRAALELANAASSHELVYLENQLDKATAVLAQGCAAVAIFVNDDAGAAALERLADGGTRLLALRSTGYNHVDLRAATALGITVVHVPAYSPHAIAEFTIGLLLGLERKIHRAWARVREDNFSLEGLVGRTLHGRTVGIVGTGRIGKLVAHSLAAGLGCRVLAADPLPDAALEANGVVYLDAAQVMAEAEFISFHCPLTPQTHHLFGAEAIARARPGVVVVNTSRGGLIDTPALIDGLKRRKIGGVALDVYEEEAGLFFQDRSDGIVQDDVFQRLLTFPNVLVTGHQAFLTEEALAEIAVSTLQAATTFESGGQPLNIITAG